MDVEEWELPPLVKYNEMKKKNSEMTATLSTNNHKYNGKSPP